MTELTLWLYHRHYRVGGRPDCSASISGKDSARLVGVAVAMAVSVLD